MHLEHILCHSVAHNFVYNSCPKRVYENFTKESIQVAKQVSMRCGIYRSLQAGFEVEKKFRGGEDPWHVKNSLIVMVSILSHAHENFV